ncbi:MAG TPA: RDD family protein [Pyrinomonadaceae bacterium]|nr:RDD family protein [Pyrinomonadaceae bacterium]
MTSHAKPALPAKPITRAPARVERVIDFSPEKLRAPMVVRAGAAIIDYILIVSPIAGFLLLARAMGNDGAGLINSELNSIGWLLAILIAATNLILLPVLTGRTFGKFLTGLRVATLNGTEPGFRRMLLRQTVGYFLIVFSAGLGLLTALFDRKGRALHDLIAGTVVIFGERKTKP